MKTYSNAIKRTAAIISITISYFLLVIFNRDIMLLLESIINNNTLWKTVEYGGGLLCISVPVLIAWYIFKLKLRHLLWVVPVILFLALVFSPSGYFIILMQRGFPRKEFNPDNWKYSITLSFLFLTIQFCAVTVAKGIWVSIERKNGHTK